MGRPVSQDQLRAARQVVALLRRSPQFRDSIAINDAGEGPIVIATPDDRMDDLLRRVEELGRGPATICIREGSAQITGMTLRPFESDGHSVDSAPVDPGITVGMFLAWARETSTPNFHLEKCEHGFEVALA